MSLPEKQQLIEEIDSLPETYYAEVLDFMQFLKQKQTRTAPSEAIPVNPLLQFAGALHDTDLKEPEDLLPEAVQAF